MRAWSFAIFLLLQFSSNVKAAGIQEVASDEQQPNASPSTTRHQSRQTVDTRQLTAASSQPVSFIWDSNKASRKSPVKVWFNPSNGLSNNRSRKAPNRELIHMRREVHTHVHETIQEYDRVEAQELRLFSGEMEHPIDWWMRKRTRFANFARRIENFAALLPDDDYLKRLSRVYAVQLIELASITNRMLTERCHFYTGDYFLLTGYEKQVWWDLAYNLMFCHQNGLTDIRYLNGEPFKFAVYFPATGSDTFAVGVKKRLVEMMLKAGIYFQVRGDNSQIIFVGQRDLQRLHNIIMSRFFRGGQ